MFKCIFLILVVIISLLLPYYFTKYVNEKEFRKELTDKNQKIIELLNEKVDAQEKIADLEDTIKLLKKLAPGGGLGCEIVVQRYETKVEMLEAEINFLKGQVRGKGKEFATCQEQFDDCSAHSYVSYEETKDPPYFIVIVLFLGFLACGCYVSGMEKYKRKQEMQQRLQERKYLYQQQQLHRLQQQQEQQQSQKAITAKKPQSKRINFLLLFQLFFD